MSETKRKKKLLTIEMKLEIINQLEMTICGNDAFYCKFVFCLSIQKKYLYLNYPWSQLAQIIGVLLY